MQKKENGGTSSRKTELKFIIKQQCNAPLGPGLKRPDASMTSTKEETEELLLQMKFPESKDPPQAKNTEPVDEEELDLADECEIKNILRKRNNNKSAPG